MCGAGWVERTVQAVWGAHCLGIRRWGIRLLFLFVVVSATGWNSEFVCPVPHFLLRRIRCGVCATSKARLMFENGMGKTLEKITTLLA